MAFFELAIFLDKKALRKKYVCASIGWIRRKKTVDESVILAARNIPCHAERERTVLWSEGSEGGLDKKKSYDMFCLKIGCEAKKPNTTVFLKLNTIDKTTASQAITKLEFHTGHIIQDSASNCKKKTTTKKRTRKRFPTLHTVRCHG